MQNFNRKIKIFRPFLSAILAVSFLFTPSAGSFAASLPGNLIGLSAPFSAPALLGIQIYPQDPLKFSFLVGQGTASIPDTEMRAAVEKAVRYFLTGLAVPEDDLWVNLSPYEQDRIIPDILSRTDAGLDMLEQDYLLKQLAASLTYPETEFGKAFWGRVYEKAKERFGTTDIPAQTFNKVWIVPEHSVVYETADRAVIAESRLKVMLESDYLAWKENSPLEEISPEQDISHDVMREIVVPLLEEEVNAGAHFAPLRQIYHALILSSWFKDRLKMTAVAQVYGDRGRIAGIEAQNGGSGAVEAVYQEYLKAYQEGAYDYIREEYEEETGEIIPKRYFSGGHTFTQVSETREDVPVPSQTLDRVLAGKREKPVMADIRFNSIKQKGPDQAMLGKDVVTGIGTAVFIEKQTFHPSFVALMQRLTALDYFVETLDELYESHSGWRRALRFIEALHSQKARARTILRTLISRLNADFAVFQQMSSQEFSYEMFDRFPDISPMKILYKQMADLPDGREKQQLQSKLRAVAQQPGGPEHFSLLMEAENEKLFKGRSIGGKTLYDLLRSIIDHPEQLPDIPGVSPMAFVRTAVEQREKFDKTYHFFIQQLEKDIVQAEPAEKMILEGYKRMLVDSKNVAVNQKINDAKKFYETQASRRKAEFERTVHAGEIKDEQEIARQRDKLEEELKAANERDGKRAEEIAQLAEDYVGGLFGHHADSEEAARWNRAKKTAEEALWLRRTASGYMGAVMDYVGQNVEKMRVMASADPASEGVRKVLSTLSEVHDITQTMFREVLLLWHWETQELQDIVKADSKMEHERALLKTDKYVRSMEAWGPGLSSRSEELKAAADIVYQYTTSIRNILARGDVGLEVVHSYRWAVLEQAFSETFKMKTDEEKETFRPLLSAIGHSIVLSAEMELPSADQYENVDIFIDDILTPSQYLSLYAHFKGKLRNIFTTKGTLTSHFALLAASHGVGVIILDKGVFPTGISNGQKVSVALEKKGNVLLHAVEDGAGGFKGGLMDILAKLNMEKVFARDPDSYIEANADTSDEVARAVADFFAKGIGLARSEDQLSDEDLPTRAFYRSKWLEMIRKASGKVITIRAFDWKSDKRTVMLSHVKYQGKKMYLEDPVGREIFKEQLRALIDLRNMGYENIRFMFPMVEDQEDLEKIRRIISEVLDETEFANLKEFPIGLGIMIETKKALENFNFFLSQDWLDFFSIGTNDLIAEMYDIQRDDVNANEYYKDVLPRIVYEIARVAQGAAAADKKVKVCGELASKRQFWIVRRILSEMGITFGLSMPANDIPYFNGVMEVLDDRAGPLMQRYEQVKEMVEKVIADEQPPALDGKYRQEFNDQLAELTGMVDHSLKKIVSATLGIDLPQSAEEGDQAMIADGSVNRRHGGVDFTRHRETVTRKQEEIPALTVSTGDGQSVTIGGEDFDGFTFEIIRMAPYEFGS